MVRYIYIYIYIYAIASIYIAASQPYSMGLITGWLNLPFTLLGLMHLDLTILCLFACGGCTGNRWTRASCCSATCKKSCAGTTLTSAYVSIRQHTSAYVSIRQHMSVRVERRGTTTTRASCCGRWSPPRAASSLSLVGFFRTRSVSTKSRQLLGHEILNDLFPPTLLSTLKPPWYSLPHVVLWSRLFLPQKILVQDLFFQQLFEVCHRLLLALVFLCWQVPAGDRLGLGLLLRRLRRLLHFCLCLFCSVGAYQWLWRARCALVAVLTCTLSLRLRLAEGGPLLTPFSAPLFYFF